MGRITKKCIAVLLCMLTVFSVLTAGLNAGTLKAEAASWNGTNYGGGRMYGYRTFLEAFGIDYDVYMKWMDDHDADSPNPDYYLGTPYVEFDHRNPNGDCDGAYGDYDTPGVAGMNCTGFVWHVLYKAAVHSGASSEQISRLKVMWEVPVSWADLGVYRIYFDSLEDAYDSGVLEKGDLMWIYGSSDNHNTIFYGDDPHDFIYWDSAGERNRLCEVHAIGECLGLYVAKVTQPDEIELQIDTPDKGSGDKFGAKYCVFDSKSKAQAAIDDPDNTRAWDQRAGTIVLDRNGHGCFRQQSAPSAAELWSGSTARTNHSYFSSDARKLDADTTYYAVQWSSTSGIPEDTIVHVFKDSGRRTPTGYRIFSFNAPYSVSTPAFTELTSTCDGVRMRWNAVRDAYQYRIYYKNRFGGWTRMAQVSGTEFTDTKVTSGTAYTYNIRCVDRDGNFISDCSPTGWRHSFRRADTPALSSLQSTPQGVKLSWNAVSGGNLYRLYYKNGKGEWKRMAQTTATTYTDRDVNTGGSYTYTIRCVDNDGNFISYYNEKGWRYTYTGVKAPQLTAATAEPDGVRLTWEPAGEGAQYRVYCKKSNGDWARIGTTAAASYLDEAVTPGHSYTYTVRCVNSIGRFTSGFDAKGLSCRYEGVGTPQLIGAEADLAGVHLTWEPVEGASAYRVYSQDSSGKWIRIGETTDAAYTDGAVKPNTTYTYTVRCVNSKGYFTGDYDHTGVTAIYTGIGTPVLNGAQAQPDGVKVSWEPVENAGLYRVYRAKSSGGWESIGETEGAEFFDGTAAPGSTCTYTVRCINGMGGYMSDYDKDGVSAVYEGVDTPYIDTIACDAEGIHLTWQPVEGATLYRVYCQKPNGGWTRIGETYDCAYTDIAVSTGSAYTYTVRCVNHQGTFISDYDPVGKKCTFAVYDTPKIATAFSEPNGVCLTWKAVEGVPLYRVYCRNANGGWTRIGETAGTTFTDEEVSVGSSYTYTVRCVNRAGVFLSDYDKAGTSCRFDGTETPRIYALLSENEGIRVRWSSRSDKLIYCVYRKSGSGWSRIAEVRGTEYLDTGIDSGETYTYTIRCMNGAGRFVSDYVKGGWSRTFAHLDTPQVTLENTAEGVNVRWEAVAGAPQYRVFYKTDGGWQRLGVTEGTEMLFDQAQPGVRYTFTVRCLGTNGNYISDYYRPGYPITYTLPEEAASDEIAAASSPAELTHSDLA